MGRVKVQFGKGEKESFASSPLSPLLPSLTLSLNQSAGMKSDSADR